MKRKNYLATFFIVLAALLVSSCGKSKKEEKKSETKSLKEVGDDIANSFKVAFKEVTVRSALARTWSYCKQEDESSTLMNIEINHTGSLFIRAHQYDKDPECVGDYESYDVAEFNYHKKINVQDDALNAETSMQLSHYYPQGKNFDNNFVRFEDEVMTYANLKLEFSKSYKDLKVVFSNIKTAKINDLRKGKEVDLSAEQINEVESFELNLREDKTAKFRMKGLGPVFYKEFDSQTQILEWLEEKLAKIIAPDCLESLTSSEDLSGKNEVTTFGYRKAYSSELIPYIEAYILTKDIELKELKSSCPILDRAQGIKVKVPKSSSKK